jgi:hypothetical protein
MKLIDRKKLCTPTVITDFVVTNKGLTLDPPAYVVEFHNPDYLKDRVEVCTILN